VTSATAHPPRFTSAELAAKVGGELLGPADLEIRGLDTVAEADGATLTFVGDLAHARSLATSAAGAAIVTRTLAKEVAPAERRAIILVDDADRAMIAALELFARPDPLPAAGVHPAAAVEPGARLGEGVRIGPGCWIASGASVGDRSVLFAGVSVYPGATVGSDCTFHANVSIRERCRIGNRVILHSGVAIGTDGFGYRPAPGGRGILKVPHLGNVVLEDEVEIGANSCVDRGKFGSTTIGFATKLDNLVQVGHNCRIGKCCVISGLSGVAGSTVIGDGTRIGGGAGLADHLTIGRGVSIAAMSGVMNDIPDGETWGGYPAQEIRRTKMEVLAVRRLPELMRKFKSMIPPEPKG
jgi:UDP-3-O-[3-hydroxymyristoyl] glucosamine N-acyltransferase